MAILLKFEQKDGKNSSKKTTAKHYNGEKSLFVKKLAKKTRTVEILEIHFSKLFDLLTLIEPTLELNLKNLSEVEIYDKIKKTHMELQEKNVIEYELIGFKKAVTLLFFLLAKSEIALQGIYSKQDLNLNLRFYKTFKEIAILIERSYRNNGVNWKNKDSLYQDLTDPLFIVTSELNEIKYLISTTCEVFIHLENICIYNEWTVENFPELNNNLKTPS